MNILQRYILVTVWKTLLNYKNFCGLIYAFISVEVDVKDGENCKKNISKSWLMQKITVSRLFWLKVLKVILVDISKTLENTAMSECMKSILFQ